MTRLESDVKQYFMKRGEWWEPESDQAGLLRSLFIEQRTILKKLLDFRGKTILDAGTGKGRFAIDFALNGAKEVFAVDISDVMLKIAKTRAIKANVIEKTFFQKSDVENLAFNDNTFDISCCMESFVHLPNPRKAMDELARVTKSRGIVVANVTISGLVWKIRYGFGLTFKDPIMPLLRSLYWSEICRPLRYLFGGKVAPFFPLSPYARLMSIQEFISLFLTAKLEIMKTIPQGPRHFPVFLTVAARKPIA